MAWSRSCAPPKWWGMREPRRILVIRRKAIGDVLVSMAVPRALRARWPAIPITLVVDRFATAVVQDSPFVDRVLVYDRRAHSKGGPCERIGAFTEWLDTLRAVRADLTLDLMGTPQTALWTRASGAPVRVGPRKRFRTWAYTDVVEPTTQECFAGDRFLDWVRVLGFDPGAWTPTAVARSAEIDRTTQEALRGFAAPRVIVNPSATWSAKAWPAGHFAALARGLRKAGVGSVLVAWGPGEERLRDRVVLESGGAAHAMPATDLPALASWLAAADLLVTTDSGPKHLAVGEGTPTLTLFGSTNPRGWQPPGAQHEWLTNPVGCHPCNRLECNVAGHPCLDDLDPTRVAATVLRMLGLELPVLNQEGTR